VATERGASSPTAAVSQALVTRAEAAVSTLLGDAVVEATVIPRGYGHDNLRVTLASGREAVVKFPYWPRPEKFARVEATLARLRETGLPCPDILAADVAGNRGEPSVILSWLPGEPLSEIWPALADDERHEIGREIGEWMARLHAVRVPGVSQGDLLLRDLDLRVGRARESGLIPDRLLDAAWAIVEPVAVSRIGEVAAIVHGDLYLDNVIVAGKPGARRLAGVIDFDRVMPDDPASEFVKIRWLVFKRCPELIEPILTGYLRAGGDPDAASPVSRRALACQLLEAIASVVYFTNRAQTPHAAANDLEMAADAWRRLTLLLEGEPVTADRA
jgi:aminoglycoside phosphotransferase (APT) family kinase protein